MVWSSTMYTLSHGRNTRLQTADKQEVAREMSRLDGFRPSATIPLSLTPFLASHGYPRSENRNLLYRLLT